MWFNLCLRNRWLRWRFSNAEVVSLERPRQEVKCGFCRKLLWRNESLDYGRVDKLRERWIKEKEKTECGEPFVEKMRGKNLEQNWGLGPGWTKGNGRLCWHDCLVFSSSFSLSTWIIPFIRKLGGRWFSDLNLGISIVVISCKIIYHC